GEMEEGKRHAGVAEDGLDDLRQGLRLAAPLARFLAAPAIDSPHDPDVVLGDLRMPLPLAQRGLARFLGHRRNAARFEGSGIVGEVPVGEAEGIGATATMRRSWLRRAIAASWEAITTSGCFPTWERRFSSSARWVISWACSGRPSRRRIWMAAS